MGWRLQFSDRPVTRVDLLMGDPGLVAVFVAPHTVHFFDTVTGADYGSMPILPPAQAEPGSLAWRTFVDHLCAPNGAYLPVVDTGFMTVYASLDGLLHLYHCRDGHLLLDVEGQVVALTHPDRDGAVQAAALDRELGTVGALDDRGWLHLYQQHVYVGSYAMGDGLFENGGVVLVPDAADQVWVVDDQQIQTMTMSGSVQARTARNGASGPATCSPDGQMLIVAEVEYDRITAYDNQLQPILRGSVPDLLASAAPLQLFDTPVTVTGRVGALAVANDGDIALAVGGTVCVTTLDVFAALPRPRRLF